jgi:hypothetical protein
MTAIVDITAREILDSRGNPIVDMAVWGWARMVPFIMGEEAWAGLPNLAQLSQLGLVTWEFEGFGEKNANVFKGWRLEIACSEDQVPSHGCGSA